MLGAVVTPDNFFRHTLAQLWDTVCHIAFAMKWRLYRWNGKHVASEFYIEPDDDWEWCSLPAYSDEGTTSSDDARPLLRGMIGRPESECFDRPESAYFGQFSDVESGVYAERDRQIVVGTRHDEIRRHSQTRENRRGRIALAQYADAILY